MNKKNILNLLYPDDEIYIRKHKFDITNKAVDVECVVPMAHQYSNSPIEYVSAENYVRCLSQSCYLLGEYLIERGVVDIGLSVQEFRNSAVSWKIFYRALSMIFHENSRKDQNFSMRLELKGDFRRIHDLVLFTFSNKRSVISGEMSFVMMLDKTGNGKK